MYENGGCPCMTLGVSFYEDPKRGESICMCTHIKKKRKHTSSYITPSLKECRHNLNNTSTN